MKRLSILTMLACLAAAPVAPAFAQAQEKLPIPRFVSLRSDEVNARLGPGAQYPIDWVYRRARMPVEIVAEFDTWRKIRDAEGAESWVHQTMVQGRRMALITKQVRVLRRKPEMESPPIARLEPGVVGEINECQTDWCRIDVGGRRGWLLKSEFYGAYPNDKID
ncbi:SH3 domain-containing protein [Lacibacterium aquatile]|uniref:SH3 domain-containing protein n=1 Tax=Lacibacterium aquatile TaxID=1168082 RepID=A0ABW5DU34_9PROT